MNRCAVLVRSAAAHDFNLRDLYAAAADLPVNMPVPTHLGGKLRAQCGGKDGKLKICKDKYMKVDCKNLLLEKKKYRRAIGDGE